MKLESVPITQAEPDPQALVRVYYNTKELEENIAKVGQIEPVVAYRKDDRYYIYVGIRRYFAIKRLYERLGRPGFILAVIEDQEPEPKAKIERIYSENEIRSPLSVYDMIDLVFFKRDIAEMLVEIGKMKKHFFQHVLSLRNYDITEDDLRRWSEIEMKVSGEVRLNIDHLEKIGRLAPEKRDFAVALLSGKNMPANGIYDLGTMLLNAEIDRDFVEKLNGLGIKDPYEEERKAELSRIDVKRGEEKLKENLLEREKATPLPPEVLSEEDRIPEIETHEAPEATEEPSESEKEERAEEKPPTVAIWEDGNATLWLNDKLYVFYAGAEPEVIRVKVEDKQTVEAEGRKFRFVIMERK